MPPIEVTNFLTSMKRKGEVLSIKGLDAQINAIMQVICLIEEGDSRIQFMKRIEVVQMDLQHLRFKLESKMPRNLKRPGTLNIDHSRLLIGGSEEGYMPLTEKIWHKIQSITQRIDRLSEGLVFIVQRHRDSGNTQPQASRCDEDRYPRSDHSTYFDPYAQDRIQQSTHSSRGPYHENLDSGNSPSDGLNHARPYYHRTISQHNQFTPAPDYFSPQAPNMNHHNRFPTKSPSSSSSQSEASRKHSYPRGNPNYFPREHQGGPSYQPFYMPWSPPGTPFWGIPSNVPLKFNDTSAIKHRRERSDRHPHRN